MALASPLPEFQSAYYGGFPLAPMTPRAPMAPMAAFQGPFFYPAGSPMPPVMGAGANFWNMEIQ